MKMFQPPTTAVSNTSTYDEAFPEDRSVQRVRVHAEAAPDNRSVQQLNKILTLSSRGALYARA